jgi:uncharacterized protein (TIGR02466 family)
MNTGKLYEIFAVPVYETELGFDVNKMTDLCRKFVKDDKGRNISNRGGYQSNDIDLSNKLFADFFANIEFHATGFASSVLKVETQFMHNAWININNFGDYNVIHNHPYSHISGVYYLKTPKDCGRLVLQNSAKDVLQYYEVDAGIKQRNQYNSQEFVLEPEPGKLYLFPSWINHYVQPNRNRNEERISIAFNTGTKQ